MTADILFKIEEKKDVLKVPNAALRFFPEPKLVRPEDRALLEGVSINDVPPLLDDELAGAASGASSGDGERPSRRARRRHVWIVDGDFLRAVEVEEGISDNRHTEVLSGELKEEQEVVVGIKPKELVAQ
jgi:HlyD family secretion protein